MFSYNDIERFFGFMSNSIFNIRKKIDRTEEETISEGPKKRNEQKYAPQFVISVLQVYIYSLLIA